MGDMHFCGDSGEESIRSTEILIMSDVFFKLGEKWGVMAVSFVPTTISSLIIAGPTLSFFSLAWMLLASLVIYEMETASDLLAQLCLPEL